MTGLRGKELAAAVVAVVEQHPERHDQNRVVHRCGTTACLVGWTLALHADSLAAEKGIGAFPGLVYDGPIPDVDESEPIAAALLGVPIDALTRRVYYQFDREKAISAFIELTGLADVEPLPVPRHAEAV